MTFSLWLIVLLSLVCLLWVVAFAIVLFGRRMENEEAARVQRDRLWDPAFNDVTDADWLARFQAELARR